jgi:hypothetical protein
MPALSDDTAVTEKPVDARVAYPCYKPFDEFIDVEMLRSLDGYVAERIRRGGVAAIAFPIILLASLVPSRLQPAGPPAILPTY